MRKIWDKAMEHNTQTKELILFCPVCWLLHFMYDFGRYFQNGEISRFYDVADVVDFIVKEKSFLELYQHDGSSQ